MKALAYRLPFAHEIISSGGTNESFHNPRSYRIPLHWCNFFLNVVRITDDVQKPACAFRGLREGLSVGGGFCLFFDGDLHQVTGDDDLGKDGGGFVQNIPFAVAAGNMRQIQRFDAGVQR